MSSSSGFDINKEIAELKAKLKELEEDLKKPNVSEAREIAIRNNIDTVGNLIAAWVNMIAAGSSSSSSPPVQAPSSMNVQAQLAKSVSVWNRQTHNHDGCASDKLSGSSASSETKKFAKALQNATFDKCVVCGFKSSQVQEAKAGNFRKLTIDSQESIYPDKSAQLQNVSRAHLIKNESLCRELGVRFKDKSNFLPLCGYSAAGQLSCHAAFDGFQLSFVRKSEQQEEQEEEEEEEEKTGQKQTWVVVAGGKYKHFHGKEIDLGDFRPHRRVLHSHAWLCLQKTFIVLDEVAQGQEEAVAMSRKNLLDEYLQKYSPETENDNVSSSPSNSSSSKSSSSSLPKNSSITAASQAQSKKQ